MSASSSISVTVRVRPFSIREAAQIERPDDAPAFFGDGSLAATRAPKLTGKGVRRVVKPLDDKVLVFDPAEENPLAKYQKTILPQGKKVKDMKFGFDRVFDENCSQQDVYECTTRPLLDSVLDGFNATVFAYGATGCGKTHTISGTPQHPGIIFLTCAELFERIRDLRNEKDISLTLSYLEIYNETIRDLLVPGGSKMGLNLREDTNSSIAIAGLSTHTPKTVEEVMDMIVMGNANRTMSPTEANATSSRSHAVLQINVIQKPRTSGVQEHHMCATLSIIDLAGSERASVTKNRGERLLEGANINRSLLALGNCINALCDPSKRNHVPYRDSKLTRLLKFSLGGNCKTVMIVCVSPSSAHYDETHNTLKYANRAKNIKTKVTRNMINVNRHVSEYVKLIYNLRQEVTDLKKRLENATKEALEKFTKQSSAKNASMAEGLRRIKAAFEQSGPLRKQRINEVQQLRVVERREAMVTAWLTAFDDVFLQRKDEDPPKLVFKMRAEAEKLLHEFESTKLVINQRLAEPSWERVIDTALQNSVRSLRTIEGVTDHDIYVLTNEARLWTTHGERDVYHALAQSEFDISNTVRSLTRAHFETVGTLHRIMNTNISEPEALEEARKSLFEIQQLVSDTLGHIIRPTGELVSHEVYQPSTFTSPRKRGHAMSPVKAPPPAQPSFPKSPVKGSPKPHKVKTPKKGVQFPPPKKSVRWHEDVFSPQPSDLHKKSKLTEADSDISFSITTSVPALAAPPIRASNVGMPGLDMDSMGLSAPSISIEPVAATSTALQPNHETAPPLQEPHSSLIAPPIRPSRSRFEAGFLSAKPKDAFSTAPSQILNELDPVDQAINIPGTSGGLSKAAIRKTSSTTTHPTSHQRSSSATTHVKRRSPSNSSQIIPEGQSVWKKGHAKRLPKGEKENMGSHTSVLSPKCEGVKREKEMGRRLTVAGMGERGGMKLSPEAVAALKEQVATGVAAGKAGQQVWR